MGEPRYRAKIQETLKNVQNKCLMVTFRVLQKKKTKTCPRGYPERQQKYPKYVPGPFLKHLFDIFRRAAAPLWTP